MFRSFGFYLHKLPLRSRAPGQSLLILAPMCKSIAISLELERQQRFDVMGSEERWGLMYESGRLHL